MNERALRIAFFPLVAGLAAVVALSVLMAMSTGYTYGYEIRSWTYPSVAKGLGAVLGAAILAVLILSHSLKSKEERIEQGLLRWMDLNTDYLPRGWDQEVESVLEEGVEVGNFGADGFQVQEALEDRRAIRRLRSLLVRLMAVPISASTVIVAVSIWAVPAVGAFLQTQAFLNTTLIFLVSYGSLVAVGSFIAGLLLSLKD